MLPPSRVTSSLSRTVFALANADTQSRGNVAAIAIETVQLAAAICQCLKVLSVNGSSHRARLQQSVVYNHLSPSIHLVATLPSHVQPSVHDHQTCRTAPCPRNLRQPLGRLVGRSKPGRLHQDVPAALDIRNGSVGQRTASRQETAAPVNAKERRGTTNSMHSLKGDHFRICQLPHKMQMHLQHQRNDHGCLARSRGTVDGGDYRFQFR